MGSEGVRERREEVVGGEVVHELLVYDGVVYFADDGEEGNWAEIYRELDFVVFCECDEFGGFENVEIVVVVDCSVEGFVDDWGNSG